jgi:hypothetical protein
MTLLLPLIASLTLAADPVSLQYEGPLNDALKQIAQKGHLNVVATGDLGERVQVSLADVTAEEALETLAKVYGLELTHQGKMYVIRRANPVGALAAPASPVAPVAPVAPGAVPGVADPGDVDLAKDPAEQVRAQAEAAREQADAAREQADAAREQAEELADARREQLDAARELAQAHAELEKNRVSAGGPVTVEKNTTVDTAVAYGGPVIVEENAVVDGDAVAFGGDVVLKPNAEVKGNAVSFGGRVVRGPNSVVRGQTMAMGTAGISAGIGKGVAQGTRIAKEEVNDEDKGGNQVAVFLLQFALFFGLGFALKMFAPQRMKVLEATIRNEPWRNLVAGVATVPASVLVCVTIVAIPVVILAWVFVAPVAVVIGLSAIANALGAVVPTWRLRRTQAVALGLGVGVMLLAFHVPVLGAMAVVLASLVSLGAVIRTRFGQPTRGTPIMESMSTAVGA